MQWTMPTSYFSLRNDDNAKNAAQVIFHYEMMTMQKMQHNVGYLGKMLPYTPHKCQIIYLSNICLLFVITICLFVYWASPHACDSQNYFYQQFTNNYSD